MGNEKQISIQVVKGGFILHTHNGLMTGGTEVFTSPAKLLKAVKAAIEVGDETTEKADKAAE